MKTRLKNKKVLSLIGLLFVVFVWGFSPNLTYELQKYYSPAFRGVIGEFIMIVSYFFISHKHIKEFNINYLKVGIPTGIFYALANLTQKIGLLHTTPGKYAFLENLSCVVVPILLYILIKKKIKLLTVISSLLCLVGVFVLNGVSFDGGWGLGEVLCAVAGILYSFNIAGTGVFAKKFYVPLYLLVQSSVSIIINIIAAITFHNIGFEKIKFTFDPRLIVVLISVTVLSSVFCWIIRTNSMKYVSPTTIAIIMPLSAVVTIAISVIMKTDVLNSNIIAGGIMILTASILSSFDD